VARVVACVFVYDNSRSAIESLCVSSSYHFFRLLFAYKAKIDGFQKQLNPTTSFLNRREYVKVGQKGESLSTMIGKGYQFTESRPPSPNGCRLTIPLAALSAR
jgi:hypothetical protein